MYDLVEFYSCGTLLRGRMYGGEDNQHSCVVMAHGTSATISMVADAYAEAIHDAGFSVLLYDHANFGDSEGEPRHEINPWLQGRGFRDAVVFLRENFNFSSIALWGDSYAGGIALVAAALIPDIAAVIAQIPVCGAELPGMEPSKEHFADLQNLFAVGNVSGGAEHTIGPVPVVSADQVNAPSILTPIQAFRWFVEYGGRFNSKWENRVTRVIPPTKVPFNAYLAAPYITAPVLMMVGRNDEMVHCNPAVQRAVFDKISSRKEFYEIDGGHFGLLWHPGPLFDEAVSRQIAFLKANLP